jgi:hypothetical protein
MFIWLKKKNKSFNFYYKLSYVRYNFYYENFLSKITNRNMVGDSNYKSILFNEIIYVIFCILFSKYKSSILNITSQKLYFLFNKIFKEYIIEIKQLLLFYFYKENKKYFLFNFQSFLNEINSMLNFDFFKNFNNLKSSFILDNLKIIEFFVNTNKIILIFNNILNLNFKKSIFFKSDIYSIQKPSITYNYIFYDYIYIKIFNIFINFNNILNVYLKKIKQENILYIKNDTKKNKKKRSKTS